MQEIQYIGEHLLPGGAAARPPLDGRGLLLPAEADDHVRVHFGEDVLPVARCGSQGGGWRGRISGRSALADLVLHVVSGDDIDVQKPGRHVDEHTENYLGNLCPPCKMTRH